MKAMLFCAGLGKRLLPITRFVPKPMIEFFGRPLVDYTLSLLSRWRVLQVVVNLHHLPEMIRPHLLASWGSSLELRFSEEHQLLGTGGGLKKVESLLHNGTFLACNSDFLLDPALDIAEMLELHYKNHAAATLLLHEDAQNAYTPIQVDENGRITTIGGLFGTPDPDVKNYAFCGMQLLESNVFSFLPQGKSCSLTEAWVAMVRAGLSVMGHVYEGYWRELGTPKNYKEAHWDVLDGTSPLVEGIRQRGDFAIVAAGEDGTRAFQELGVVVHPDATFVPPLVLGRGCYIAKAATVGPYAVLGQGVRAAKGASIERSVVWRGAAIGSGVALKDSILFR